MTPQHIMDLIAVLSKTTLSVEYHYAEYQFLYASNTDQVIVVVVLGQLINLVNCS
jgi:hypothetical protein